jgi:predicted transcriptional regulator YheO
MDKDESYENVQEAEENFAYELEMQQQEEEQEDKFLKRIKDNNIGMLCLSVDANKNLNWLIQYYLEQEQLYPENHKECINRTNQKLNKEKTNV